MVQYSLFEDVDHIVNVASVPLRSPFRYPGGKTWLVPRIRVWLANLKTKPKLFVEPFAGGGIVGLTVAFEKLADHVLLVELDDQVAAVWRVILSDDAEWLTNRIINFNLTKENVDEILSQDADTLPEKAFQTIINNRVNHGGIMAPGAGRIKFGESGKGIKSRWYPETLKKRILAISKIRERITFIEGDGIKAMQQHQDNNYCAFFVDPPYTAGNKKAGKRLYKHSEIDHNELFRISSLLAGDFLITYDNNENIRDLSAKHSLETQLVSMKNTHHARMKELLIGRDLSWARPPTP